MTKRELLEACARASGRTLVFNDHGVPGYYSLFRDHLPQWNDWNPIDSSHDCGEMEAQMQICIDWCNDAVVAQPLADIPGVLETFADHASPQAARRMAVCRAVAQTEDKP